MCNAEYKRRREKERERESEIVDNDMRENWYVKSCLLNFKIILYDLQKSVREMHTSYILIWDISCAKERDRHTIHSTFFRSGIN